MACSQFIAQTAPWDIFKCIDVLKLKVFLRIVVLALHSTTSSQGKIGSAGAACIIVDAHACMPYDRWQTFHWGDGAFARWKEMMLH
jgi:hypothetical protein